MKRFTNCYSVAKTIRFELRPVGKTMEHIEQFGLLAEDEHRAASYKGMKRLIDRYHKAFIELALGSLSEEDKIELRKGFAMLYDLYKQAGKEKGDKDVIEEQRVVLRKEIAKLMTRRDDFKDLFSERLFKEFLPGFVSSPEERALLDEFSKFITYFIGFMDNRRNIYTSEKQSTAIAYRLVDDNFPKFMGNALIYMEVRQALGEQIEELGELFGDRLLARGLQSVDELFALENFCNTFTQSGIELYNSVLGKIVTEDGVELKGLNERINLYNQHQDKGGRLPLLKPLYKQILSDREQLSWLPESFESDASLLRAIADFYATISVDVLEGTESLMSLLRGECDLGRIYYRADRHLTSLSRHLLGDWAALNQAREYVYDEAFPPKKRESLAYETKRKKALSAQKSLSLSEIDRLARLWSDTRGQEMRVGLVDYLAYLGSTEPSTSGLGLSLTEAIRQAYANARPLLVSEPKEGSNLKADKESVASIKALMDALIDLHRFLSPLWGCEEEHDRDEHFYGELDHIWTLLREAIPLYNKVRSYLTQKPYSIEKIKLNFGNSTLLAGWDKNKERDNSGVILRRGEHYYLAIMHKEHRTAFLDKNVQSSGPCYDKMDYKLLPGPNKMLPKVFFSRERMKSFTPEQEQLYARYKAGTHKKGSANYSQSDMHCLVDFFKQSIAQHEDWSKFGFVFSPTESYEDMSQFYREVAEQAYKVSFRPISEAYIHQLIDEGKLFLFQIWNKDFSSHSKGTPNLHTLYWRMLFDPRNLSDVVYKLNGEAEVFYRKRSLPRRITHPAGEPIKRKLIGARERESLFPYDLIKDKRFTVDKFLFHVPITIGFKAADMGASQFNAQVQDFVREHKETCVIGIDRGERHLLYVSVIDSRGRILEQHSLNIIDPSEGKGEDIVDYHAILEERGAKRQEQRQSWSQVEEIRNIKQGYLSQVVHKITQLMIKYQAIVALEDLNMGFKQSRQKVESSVYQQFERQLIDKLNLLVNKQADPMSPGGVLRPYQLAPKFESFQKMGKQTGFLFYVPAQYTSKIDPHTGFVSFFDTRYESVDKARAFFAKFDGIRYSAARGWFEFDADYSKFGDKAKDSRTQWTLCSQGERIVTLRNPEHNNQWESQSIDLTKAMEELFAEYGIAYREGGDLRAAIGSMEQKSFFVALLRLFKLMVQMRNSRTGTDEDYILSPVAGEDGRFFDSRRGDASLPQDADANGAYHIALKGLWALQQIRQCEQKPNLAITRAQWLAFVQQRQYLTNDK